MRILAGTCVRQHPEVLEAHLTTMRWQDLPDGVTLDLCYIDDNDDPAASAALRRAARALPAGERGDAAYGIGEFTHEWNVASFHRLASEKQRLLELAICEGYDAIWLVDSDLLSDPGTLRSLLDCAHPIVSATFWTRWTPDSDPLPQVWQTHPYGFDGAGWTGPRFLQALEARELVRVRGLGANTLIRREALLHGAGFWPLLADLPEGGMWQGEDRHFSVRAERLHIPLYADAWPEVWHCYRPSQREELAQQLERLQRVRLPAPRELDWVSLAIEPLEEPALAGHVEHVRGRLGMLRLAPELEAAIRTCEVGDAKFVRASIMGSERMLRIRLLDVHDATSRAAP
jgi:hypothetical protein